MNFSTDDTFLSAVSMESGISTPSFGEPRTVTFDYPIPEGKAGSLEISVIVSDVAYEQVVVTQGFDLEGGGSPRKARRARKK
jgi:hypothetical protein